MAAEAVPREQVGSGAERVTAFVDGVVAIALTLLILPLMESVGEVAGAGDDALTWLGDHTGQLLSFVLSFVLIAMFWMIHHRLFADVERVSSSFMWLLAGWLLTIVWLPVATAIAGRMDDDDGVARDSRSRVLVDARHAAVGAGAAAHRTDDRSPVLAHSCRSG